MSVRPPRLDLRWATLRRQFAESLMLPLIAVALPWPLAWRTIRRLAARERFFGDETRRAQAACETQRLVTDAGAWSRRHRLMRMIDHVDPALSFFRTDRFLDRYVAVDGDPVPAGPCVFVGFHYGTGFWTLRHLRRLAHRVAFLAAPVTAQHCPGQPLALAFMRFRKVCVEHAGGAPVILVGGSRERIRASLRAGTSVLGLIDVPDARATPMPVTLLGHATGFPDGLVRIACEEHVPIVGYVASLDATHGTRGIRFTRLPDDPARAVPALAALLDEAIRSDPAAWHFWPEWDRFAKAAAREGSLAGVR